MDLSLFSSLSSQSLPGTPLAERLRPRTRQQLLGQAKVMNQIERYLSSGRLPSMIFWGPPGSGKTSLAQALASETSAEFVSINAVESGAKALKEIGEKARQDRLHYQKQTILFVDEIHRFNKAQQDVLLPFVEKGDLILIGATTENPSYELNRALLSRCRLLVFERHGADSMLKLFVKVLTEDPQYSDLAKQSNLSEQSSSAQIKEFISKHLLDHQALSFLLSWADGDARRFLLAVDEILLSQSSYESKAKISFKSEILNKQQLQDLLGQTVVGYDRASDQHYDCASALIKSIRGSDADAAIYYLARMLAGGEDILFIARRLVILASEDVGNADPRALQVAVAGAQAAELVGLPEAAINLAQVVTYLASAPKSNRSYLALKKAQSFIQSTGTPPVPLKLRSADTPEMRSLGYKQGYLYPHDFPKSWVEQNYWPEDIKAEVFYSPSENGFEKQITEYAKWLRQLSR